MLARCPAVRPICAQAPRGPVVYIEMTGRVAVGRSWHHRRPFGPRAPRAARTSICRLEAVNPTIEALVAARQQAVAGEPV